MNFRTIYLILCASENNLIGIMDLKTNKFMMPWNNENKEDLKYFQQITSGSTVVMGYNTFLSLNRKPLKNRRNIVLTRNHLSEQVEGFEFCTEIDYKLSGEIFIIGGKSLYDKYWQRANYIYLTRYKKVFNVPDGFQGIYVNDVNEKEYRLISRTETENNIFEIYSKR